MKRVTHPRLMPNRRPNTGVGEWLAAMVRGLDALDFLERSRELAAEPVTASPARRKSDAAPRQPPQTRIRFYS
jgi:hypothetical protein